MQKKPPQKKTQLPGHGHHLPRADVHTQRTVTVSPVPPSSASSSVGTDAAIIRARAYSGGVYSPRQRRIYFAPSRQANASAWHYLDADPTSATVGAAVPYPPPNVTCVCVTSIVSARFFCTPSRLYVPYNHPLYT